MYCTFFIWLAAEWVCSHQHHCTHMSIVLHCDIRMTPMSLGDRNFSAPLKSSGIMVAYTVNRWSKYHYVLHDCTKNKNLHFAVLSGMIEVFLTLRVPHRTSHHCGDAGQGSKHLASIESSYVLHLESPWPLLLMKEYKNYCLLSASAIWKMLTCPWGNLTFLLWHQDCFEISQMSIEWGRVREEMNGSFLFTNCFMPLVELLFLAVS